jgi:hypothetical protein
MLTNRLRVAPNASPLSNDSLSLLEIRSVTDQDAAVTGLELSRLDEYATFT